MLYFAFIRTTPVIAKLHHYVIPKAPVCTTSHNQRARKLTSRGGRICEFTTKPDKTLSKLTLCTYFHPHHTSHCKITSFQKFVILNICHSKKLTSHTQRVRKFAPRGSHICKFTTKPDKTSSKLTLCTYIHPHHTSHCKTA